MSLHSDYTVNDTTDTRMPAMLKGERLLLQCQSRRNLQVGTSSADKGKVRIATIVSKHAIRHNVELVPSAPRQSFQKGRQTDSQAGR